MILGLDFDNTIVSYDGVFFEAAVEQKLLPAGPALTKEALRNLLREQDREDDWTRLQGFVYGPRMSLARPYPGAKEFLTRCRAEKVAASIISHRTRTPYLGPKYDLFAAARDWLKKQGIGDLVPAERIFFEETKQAKLSRIASEGCTHFVDDLPEFLAEPSFPSKPRRILFDPASRHQNEKRFERAASWEALAQSLLSESQGPA